MKQSIRAFKECVREAMLQNFEADGKLVPLFFFIKKGKPGVSAIPAEYFNSNEAKIKLSYSMKSFCKEKDVACAGIVFEAFVRVCDSKNEEEAGINKLLLDGTLRVAQLNEKRDAIIMIFSTPDSEENISYYVDPATKTVKEQLPTPKGGDTGGLFSNFFELREKVN